MKTSQLITAMTGAALLSGAALAQADGPRGPGPRDGEPGLRPDGERRERMERMEMRERAEQRERMMRPGGTQARPEGGCPGGCPGGGCPEGGRPGMQQRRGGPDGAFQPPMQRGGPMLGRGPQAVPGPERLKELGATDQQMEALCKLDEEKQLKRIDLQAAAEKAEVSLGQLMRAEKPDEAAALKAADALNQARGELMKLEISSKLKTQEVLGAELVKKLREMGPPEGAPGPRMGRPGASRQPGEPRKDAPAAEDKPRT